MSARIFQRPKNAMQSGKARTGQWILEFDPAEAKQPDPLMGWAGSGDMRPAGPADLPQQGRPRWPMPPATALPRGSMRFRHARSRCRPTPTISARCSGQYLLGAKPARHAEMPDRRQSRMSKLLPMGPCLGLLPGTISLRPLRSLREIGRLAAIGRPNLAFRLLRRHMRRGSRVDVCVRQPGQVRKEAATTDSGGSPGSFSS